MTDQPHDAVVDGDQPTDRPPDHVDQPVTDQPTTPPPRTLDEAALELGITVNAVRQRIKRGTLTGIKTDAGWLVDMVATDQEPGSDRPTTRPTNQAASATDHQPTIDLAPLVSHIATLEDQVQRLAESNTMWQIRARQAEEQLKQLTAGNMAPDSAAEAVESLQTNEIEPRGFWDKVRRFWSG